MVSRPAIYADRERPVCPFCLVEDEAPWEIRGLEDDGDESEIECQSCGRAYVVRLELVATYTTSAPDDEEQAA